MLAYIGRLTSGKTNTLVVVSEYTLGSVLVQVPKAAAHPRKGYLENLHR